MTQTADPEAPPAAWSRADYITGFTDLAVLLAGNSEVPLPGGTAGVFVPIHLISTARGERLAELDWIAEVLGTQVTCDEDGTLYARRCFGPVTLVAQVSPEGSAHIVARMDRMAAGAAA